MPVKPQTTITTPGASSNIGQQVREQRQAQADTSATNRALAQQGVSFDPTSQTINRNALGGAQRTWEQYYADNPLMGTAAGAINVAVQNYTPKIRVNDAGDGLIVSGTKTALESGLTKELKEYLSDALAYQDLTSKNTADIIDALNKDLAQQIERSVVENGLGVEYDKYKDYAHMVEVMASTNPLNRNSEKDKIIGLLKDGKTAYKTPSEWLDYYTKEYSSKDRAKLFQESAEKINGVDFAAQTPFIVMTGGRMGQYPIYGFSTREKFLAGLKAGVGAIGEIITGLGGTATRATRAFDYLTKNTIDSQAKALNVTPDYSWMSEEDFNSMLNSLSGKKKDDLTDKEKSFLLIALYTPRGQLYGPAYQGEGAGEAVLDYAFDGDTIKDNLGDIISYDSYIDTSDRVSSLDKLEEGIARETAESPWGRLQEETEAASIYAPVGVTAGNFVGVLTRLIGESLLLKKPLGTNLMGLGDEALSRIGVLAARHAGTSATARGLTAALNAPFGRFLLSVAAEVPEDVLQVSIDNVLTGKADENTTLLTPGALAQNTLENLIIRGAFSVAKQGVNALDFKRAVKQAADESGLSNTINVEDFFDDASALQEARDTGNITGVTEDGKVKIRNTAGQEQTLENVSVLDFTNMSDDPMLESLADKYTSMYRGQTSGIDDFYYNNPGRKSKVVGDGFFLSSDLGVSSAFADNVSGGVLEGVVPASKIASSREVFDVFRDAERVVSDAAEYGRLAANNPRLAELYDEAAGRQYSAVARILNKPIVAYFDDPHGDEFIYYREIDPDFDMGLKNQLDSKYARVKSLFDNYEFADGVTPNKLFTGAPQWDSLPFRRRMELLDSLEDRMIDDPERALEMLDEAYKNYVSEEFGTPGEVVSENIKDENIELAPNTASDVWESPTIEGEYPSIVAAMADQPNGLSLPEVKDWAARTKKTFFSQIDRQVTPRFQETYPTPTEQKNFVRNMHYLFDLQVKQNTNLQRAVGKTLIDIDGTELKIEQSDIDFYNEVLEPIMAPLREAGAAGQGISETELASRSVVGYLPHSDYTPFDMTSEEALQQGNLWKSYTGASMEIQGNFTTTTLTNDLNKALSIFADNMIWDSLGDKAIVAKFMDELHAEGVETSAENVQKMVDQQKALAKATKKATSAKNVAKYLNTDAETTFDWDDFNKAVEDDAKKLGAARALHTAYNPIYGSAGKGAYQSATQILTRQTSDVMRTISTPDGSLYDCGGSMVVQPDGHAKYLARQIMDAIDNKETTPRQVLTEFLIQRSRRSKKSADKIADNWILKLSKDADSEGKLTELSLRARLTTLIYSEGSSRVKRWIGRADLDKFNSQTVEFLNNFSYRQGLLSRQLNDTSFWAKFNKITNKLIDARMKSVFWLNIKNGILQASENIRLFTEFKLGDALKTIKRLASDKEFFEEARFWVQIVAPERDYSKSADAVSLLSDIAEKTSVSGDAVNVEKFSSSEIAKMGNKIDKAAMTPVNVGENSKNLILTAGILQEAKKQGLEGSELFDYINRRFERIGLANTAMGRLAGADNPFFRLATNLKSFGIREARMFINNINDKNKGEAVGYIIKNLGWRTGLAAIMAKFGYSVTQSLGLDPFGILSDSYTGVDEEDYNDLDKVIAGPVGTAFLSGGFTSYLAQAYWGARQAYEAQVSSPADEADRRFSDRKLFELAPPQGELFDNMLSFGSGFVPGYTQGKRVIDMAELMAQGWATSATGNLMYAAPDDAINTVAGFVFGRGNTKNARTYFQTADPLQGLIEGGLPGFSQQFFGRGLNIGGGYRQFDPIDKENYTDWFYGDSRDDQQWNAGYYYFRELAQQLQDEYQKALRNSYNEEDSARVYNSYNEKLRELDDAIGKFVQAYQAKNPGKFDANKMNNILTIMRTHQPSLSADELERSEEYFDANDAALQRYVAAGLPQQVSYRYKDGGTEVEYSPQVRAAVQGNYGLPEEASRLIKQIYNDKWKKLNKEYRDRYYATKNGREKRAIQAEYFELVRKDLDPIVALYGASIFGNDEVSDIMEDVFNSMMPYGQTTKKYLQNKYKDYMAGSISYSQPGGQTIDEIRRLLDEGRTARAKALARTLLQRVQENRQALTRDELEWLQGVLND